MDGWMGLGKGFERCGKIDRKGDLGWDGLGWEKEREKGFLQGAFLHGRDRN
jgi:hypothetical protein